MTAVQAEVYGAFRTLEVSDDKAMEAAIALTSAFASVQESNDKSFTKRDNSIEIIGKDVIALGKDLTGVKLDLSGVKVELAGVKGELVLHRWMLGFVLATNVAIVFKLFGH